MNTTFEPLTQSEKQTHQAMGSEPAVFVSTYRKYNECSLDGQWIDLTSFSDYDDFCDYCYRLHHDEKDPEFMVQDFENYPRSLYHECGLPTEQEFDRINEFAELYNSEREAYQIYLDNYNAHADVREFQDHYDGLYHSGAEFAEYLCEECGDLEQVPEFLRDCIDFEAVWHTLDTSGDYSEYDGHIFHY